MVSTCTGSVIVVVSLCQPFIPRVLHDLHRVVDGISANEKQCLNIAQLTAKVQLQRVRQSPYMLRNESVECE
jgi:hypothetical protein